MSADKWIWGCVTANGFIYSGSGFKVTRTDIGRYEIIYDSQFSGTPAVVVTQNYPGWDDFTTGGGSSLDNCVLVASDQTHFKVRTGDGTGGASDRNFTFIAMGLV